MAKLKVFQATLGFHGSVVATTSRHRTLEAWGVRQDLFAEGMASEAEDTAAIKAALAQPGVPLLRAIGDTGDFKAEAGSPKRAIRGAIRRHRVIEVGPSTLGYEVGARRSRCFTKEDGPWLKPTPG
jgi:hypothetical protein